MNAFLTVIRAPSALFLRFAGKENDDAEQTVSLLVNMLFWNTLIVLGAAIIVIRG